jgi:hypothetical protein
LEYNVQKQLSIFILFFIGIGFLSAQDWHWQKIDEEKISILTPGVMEYKEVEMKTDIGLINRHFYFYQDTTSESGNYLYTLSYYDYPPGSFHPDSIEFIELFLDLTVEGSVKALDGDLLYDGDIEMWGFPAKIWRVSIQNGAASVKNQVILADDRVITMQVFTHPGKSKNNQIDQFLKSIKIKSKA